MTIALGIVGFVAFAYVGDLSPQYADVSQTVTLTLK